MEDQEKEQTERNIVRTRMDFELRRQEMRQCGRFRRTYRVSEALFDQILEKIRPDVESTGQCASRWGGSKVTVEIKLSLTLQWLAGGSYLDLVPMHGVGYASFYKYLWQTLEACNR